MWLKFTKMHGAGNDFVVLDGINTQLKLSPGKIRRIADRHFGVGCDQVLIVEAPSSPEVDFNYRIFNQDGSEVGQCGNGARCFAKYVKDRKLCSRNPVRVQTQSGQYQIGKTATGLYETNMGAPDFEAQTIPLATEENCAHYQINVAGYDNVRFAAVSMGNPHAVIEVEDIDIAPLESLGPALESHPFFPERANIGFMQIQDRNNIRLRVYERGAGETLACGTGACAAAVIGIRDQLLDQCVQVHLPGGTLEVEWHGGTNPVWMRGPAKTVYQGQLRI